MRLFQISSFSLLSILFLWFVFPANLEAQPNSFRANLSVPENGHKSQGFAKVLKDFSVV